MDFKVRDIYIVKGLKSGKKDWTRVWILHRRAILECNAAILKYRVVLNTFEGRICISHR